MKVIETALPDVLLLEPRVFEDERGHFFGYIRISPPPLVRAPDGQIKYQGKTAKTNSSRVGRF
ncbi:hypothetical protein [Acidiferrobacter sp.]